MREDGPVPDAPDPLRTIPLAHGGLDRQAERRRDPDLIARLLADPTTRVLPVAAGAAPLAPAESLFAGPALSAPAESLFAGLAPSEPGPTADASERGHASPPALGWRAPEAGDTAYGQVFLGVADGAARVALLLPRDKAGAGWVGLRECGADLDPADAEALTTATALGNWHATHRHCPRCGAPTEPANSGWTRRCPQDGSEHFPRTDPAIIVAVTDPEDRLLLARNPAWPEGRLSVLAGFVEPGESLAMTVAREVFEEVGVRVRDVIYLGDQPWPFPASLMLGFEARTDDPTLVLDPTEIAEAAWFTRADYRRTVDEGAWGGGTSVSISRRLIQHWLARG